MIQTAHAPALPRALGLRDLVLLQLVAIVNVSLAPPVAAFGWISVLLWVAAFLAFFVPEAVAVIAFTRVDPGEGGVYLWTRRRFGRAHGFLAGWCYFTNNLFYIPMQLVYVAGVLAFAVSASPDDLVNQKWYVAGAALGSLAIAAAANIRGLGTGKWVQNAGAVGTFVSVGLLLVLAWHAPPLAGNPPADATPLDLAGAFSVMCFAFIGIELASTMGDEMRDPQRDMPRAIVWTGLLALGAFVLITLSVQALVPMRELRAIQGVMQAVRSGAGAAGLEFLIAPLACMMALSVGGAASAWFAGASRIPFVAGQHGELPAVLGRVHPTWRSPYVALGLHGVASAALVGMALAGSSVPEAYQVLLRSAVVIQLVPFLYLFVALMNERSLGRLPRAAGVLGLATTSMGIAASFVPGADVDSVLVFELKMIAGCVGPTLAGMLMYRAATKAAGGATAGAAVEQRADQ